jgi:hypothetical protein
VTSGNALKSRERLTREEADAIRIDDIALQLEARGQQKILDHWWVKRCINANHAKDTNDDQEQSEERRDDLSDRRQHETTCTRRAALERALAERNQLAATFRPLRLQSESRPKHWARCIIGFAKSARS